MRQMNSAKQITKVLGGDVETKTKGMIHEGIRSESWRCGHVKCMYLFRWM